MKKFLLFIVCVLSLQTAFAQTDSTKVKDTTQIADANREYDSAQIEATFPGGPSAWRKYLKKNMKSNLMEECSAEGLIKKNVLMQTVHISFRVNKDGKISDVKAENADEVCPLLAAEAVRLLEQSPKWIPAQQDGRIVIYRQRQSITWALTLE